MLILPNSNSRPWIQATKGSVRQCVGAASRVPSGGNNYSPSWFDFFIVDPVGKISILDKEDLV
jgi:hypothetical protein